ncbi:four helix bundle protein [Rubrivirga sp. IMCC45206]|uniref:four helix bundle protein n=1 Tax=Rubrivirga sp. IMCC45206 TaxID=3391614 RepID=UPI00398FE913
MRGEDRGTSGAAGRVDAYTDLKVWQAAMALADAIYDCTARFPKHETFGLASQLRRAAVSIPSNIAEGWGRGQTKEYLQFLRYSRGSLYEVETQIRIAGRREYVDAEEVRQILRDTDEISRMLAGLSKSLRRPKALVPHSSPLAPPWPLPPPSG